MGHIQRFDSIGYDDIISIEREDSYMSVEEVGRAVSNLKQVMMFQPASTPKAFAIDERFKIAAARCAGQKTSAPVLKLVPGFIDRSLLEGSIIQRASGA
jgi:hypothetical protein